MSEREAFIAAVAAEPEEDLPRLAFADWLDENGETGRARFIRLQCWLAQRERSYPTFEDRFSDPLFEKLYQRARDLLDAYEEDWFGKFSRAVGVVPTAPVSEQPRRTWLDRLLRRPTQPLGATRVRDSFTGGSAEFKIWGDAAATSFYLTRGFVDALSLSMSRPKPPPSFPLAFRLEPVSRMWIDIAPSMVGWHAIDGPHLMRLKNLGLAPPNEARRKSVAVFEAILGGSHWTGLQSLTLYCPTGEQLRIPPAYLTTLARTSLVFTLSSLSIVTNLDGLVILAASSNLSRLRSLTAWGCELPSGTGGVLADAPFWEHLEHLDLSSNHLGDEVVWGLLWNKQWPQLRSLNLGFNDLGDATVRVVSLVAEQLEKVCLSGNAISDSGALTLADALDPNRLRELWLSYNPLSPHTVQRLRERFGHRFHFTTREDDAIRRRSPP